jgi:ethanolamine utilization protein EutN
MRLGRVVGRIWATQKDEKLVGIKLYIMQPVDELDSPQGKPLVCADVIGAREGDLIYWVGGAEACMPYAQKNIPSDVTIVGLVERKDL